MSRNYNQTCFRVSTLHPYPSIPAYPSPAQSISRPASLQTRPTVLDLLTSSHRQNTPSMGHLSLDEHSNSTMGEQFHVTQEMDASPKPCGCRGCRVVPDALKPHLQLPETVTRKHVFMTEIRSKRHLPLQYPRVCWLPCHNMTPPDQEGADPSRAHEVGKLLLSLPPNEVVCV